MADVKDLRVVVGLGKTGLSCVRFLVSQGHRVAVVDSRLDPPGLASLRQTFPDVTVHLGSFDETLLNNAAELIVSPGVSLKEPIIAKQFSRKIPIIGDIELFARHAKKPIVGITGSNGKSTVTSLVGYLAANAGLNVKVGGNLGTPALELLNDDETDLYVLELSSFQLESTYSLKTVASVILNICADHMDRYVNLAEYIQAKKRIYNTCQRPIINLDDTNSYPLHLLDSQQEGFTLNSPPKGIFGLCQQEGESFLAYGDKILLPTSALRLKGKHQYANALAALALGHAIGLPLENMADAIRHFEGLPHRCQWVANMKGVDWFNDSKATNVGSALAAIEGLGPETAGKLIILAGGQGKNADFSELYDSVTKYVKTLILFGQDKHLIANALKGAAPILLAEDLAQATQLAQQSAKEGDAVMLAPACASFDMFNNFEHRGEVFMELVRGLIVERE